MEKSQKIKKEHGYPELIFKNDAERYKYIQNIADIVSFHYFF